MFRGYVSSQEGSQIYFGLLFPGCWLVTTRISSLQDPRMPGCQDAHQDDTAFLGSYIPTLGFRWEFRSLKMSKNPGGDDDWHPAKELQANINWRIRHCTRFGKRSA